MRPQAGRDQLPHLLVGPLPVVAVEFVAPDLERRPRLDLGPLDRQPEDLDAVGVHLVEGLLGRDDRRVHAEEACRRRARLCRGRQRHNRQNGRCRVQAHTHAAL